MTYFQKKIISLVYLLNHEGAVPISVALCQDPHYKVAAVASRWQRVEI